MAAENIETPADQGKTFIRKILHRRNKGQPPVEPRLDGVLVSGSDVGEVAGLQRANVSVDDLGNREGRRRCTILPGARPGKPRNAGKEEDSRGNGNQAPSGNPHARGRSGGGIETSANFLAELDRGVFVKTATLKRRAQRFLGSQSSRAFVTAFQVALEFRSTRGIQLVIQIPVQERGCEITAHGRPPAERTA